MSIAGRFEACDRLEDNPQRQACDSVRLPLWHVKDHPMTATIMGSGRRMPEAEKPRSGRGAGGDVGCC